MKSAKEYIILFIIIIGLGGYLIFHKTGNTRYKLPEIPKTEAKDISKIVINKKGSNIEIRKKGDTWIIMPQKYKADKNKVKAMADSLASLDITAMVSEGENAVPYELDPEHRIHVTAFSGDKKIRDIELGKLASTYRHTFVRIDGNKKIFHARGNLKNTFNKTIDDLRDKTVLSFETADIGKIELNGKNKTLRLALTTPKIDVKSDTTDKEKASEKSRQPSWIDASGAKVETSKVNEFLKKLSHLKCRSFINGKTKKDFKEPIFTARLSGTKDYSLNIYKMENPKADKYPAISSESDYPFYLSEYLAKDIMKKLLPEEKKKTKKSKTGEK